MKSYARKEASLQKTKRFTVAVDVGVLSKLGISHCEFLLQLFFFFSGGKRHARESENI